MRVLIATDAWHPQVNGVVRTLTSLQRSARRLGAEIGFLTPEGFPSLPVPTYAGLRLALPNGREVARRVETFRPDVIHIATEGTIGHQTRAYCLARKRPFTTSFHTKFPEYIAVRFAIPEAWTYRVLRRFHAVTMAATASLVCASSPLAGSAGSRFGHAASTPSCFDRHPFLISACLGLCS